MGRTHSRLPQAITGKMVRAADGIGVGNDESSTLAPLREKIRKEDSRRAAKAQSFST